MITESWYKFHCLAVGWDETAGRSLSVLGSEGGYPEGRLSFPLEAPIPVGAEGTIRLAASVDHGSLQFAYALNGERRRVGPVLDASLLSDEAGGGEHRSFTGAFVGLVAFGASGGEISADFRYFDYEGRAAQSATWRRRSRGLGRRAKRTQAKTNKCKQMQITLLAFALGELGRGMGPYADAPHS